MIHRKPQKLCVSIGAKCISNLQYRLPLWTCFTPLPSSSLPRSPILFKSLSKPANGSPLLLCVYIALSLSRFLLSNDTYATTNSKYKTGINNMGCTLMARGLSLSLVSVLLLVFDPRAACLKNGYSRHPARPIIITPHNRSDAEPQQVISSICMPRRLRK